MHTAEEQCVSFVFVGLITSVLSDRLGVPTVGLYIVSRV
jgi:hypothetical protein